MPLTTTHALVPLAACLAFAKPPVPWRLVIAASIAAAAPDLDGLTDAIWGDSWNVSTYSIYVHRGATHSLFVALAFGLVAGIFHRRLKVGALTAGVVVAAAMASHGLMDMMTDSGSPVAYLWPLSSVRLFADWRPIRSLPLSWNDFANTVLARQQSELLQIIVPMFLAAGAVRIGTVVITRFWSPRTAEPDAARAGAPAE